MRKGRIYLYGFNDFHYVDFFISIIFLFIPVVIVVAIGLFIIFLIKRLNRMEEKLDRILSEKDFD